MDQKTRKLRTMHKPRTYEIILTDSMYQEKKEEAVLMDVYTSALLLCKEFRKLCTYFCTGVS